MNFNHAKEPPKIDEMSSFPNEWREPQKIVKSWLAFFCETQLFVHPPPKGQVKSCFVMLVESKSTCVCELDDTRKRTAVGSVGMLWL